LHNWHLRDTSVPFLWVATPQATCPCCVLLVAFVPGPCAAFGRSTILSKRCAIFNPWFNLRELWKKISSVISSVARSDGCAIPFGFIGCFHTRHITVHHALSPPSILSIALMTSIRTESIRQTIFFAARASSPHSQLGARPSPIAIFGHLLWITLFQAGAICRVFFVTLVSKIVAALGFHAIFAFRQCTPFCFRVFLLPHFSPLQL